eukprot:COSAG02_NODE_21687_length_778_cov_1.536082_1_plen_24_part_10
MAMDHTAAALPRTRTPSLAVNPPM